MFATDRALELVVGGMPFREAYHHVKDHIADLTAASPAKAVAARRHLGAAGNLGLAELGQRLRTEKKFVTKERGTYYRAIGKLLGTEYPELS